MSVTPSILRKVATFITWAAIEPRSVDIQGPTQARIHLLGPDQLHVLSRLTWYADEQRFEYETEPTVEACPINVGTDGEYATVWFALTVVRAGITYRISTSVISQPHVERLRDKIPGLRDAKEHEAKAVTLDLLRELAAEAVTA